jgi:hypothetical protein
VIVRGIFFDAIEVIRQHSSQLQALGLEFIVASDILSTAVAPTRQDTLNQVRLCCYGRYSTISYSGFHLSRRNRHDLSSTLSILKRKGSKIRTALFGSS